MAEAKVFPMNTFVSFIKGVNKEAQKKEIVEVVGYMADMEINEELAPFASALAKAWIYEQHPELIKMDASALSAEGKNVSLPMLPADVIAEVKALFDNLTETKKTAAEQAVKLAKVESELKEKTAVLADVEARMKAAETKAASLEASMKDQGEKLIVASETKVTEYIGKVDELLKMIEDVKKHGVVTVSGGGAPAGGAAPAGAPEAGGEPEADFGFGGDPFSGDSW
jgi:hypothetical protein